MTDPVHGIWWSESGWFEGICEHTTHISSLQVVRSIDDKSDPHRNSGPDAYPVFIPAPVDLHIHGCGGHDVMAGEDALRGMLKSAGSSATGALLATSVTAPAPKISRFLQTVQSVLDQPDAASARLLGAHLEGPYINPDKLGAQPPYAQAVDLVQLEGWLQTGVVRVITFAPELEQTDELLHMCESYKVRAQIGHTLCSWQTAVRALQSGCGVTHLFNAMSGAQGRQGGAAIAALAHAEFAEIITDGVHVDRVAFAAANRSIPHLYSVTDATAAAGMPDGQYRLGELEVAKSGDSVRLPDGTLAGSCLTQRRSIEVLRSWGVSWHEIARLTSVIPALWISDTLCGSIAEGSWASWLEISDDRVVAIWLAGSRHVL